jgi:hypothetical protein
MVSPIKKGNWSVFIDQPHFFVSLIHYSSTISNNSHLKLTRCPFLDKQPFLVANCQYGKLVTQIGLTVYLPFLMAKLFSLNSPLKHCIVDWLKRRTFSHFRGVNSMK